MKTAKLLVVTTALVLMNAALAAAQVIIQIKPNAAQQLNQTKTNQDDEDLIRAVFDPITEDLKLTPNQKFRIVTIATATMGGAEVLFEQLDDLDARLSVAAFSGQLDESKIKLISDKQAVLLGEIIAMKARAKASFYKVLTAEQRQLIVNQYRLRGVENLGSIGNLDH